MDTIQRQSNKQNLPKPAETAEFSDIYIQDYSGYLEDTKDYHYLNGRKILYTSISMCFSISISPVNIFSFVNLLNELLAFLG